MNLKLQFSLSLSLALCLVANFLQIDSVDAQQITSDGTTGTTVTSEGNNFTIQDGTRNGGNLFHSFQDFSVPTGGSAFFNNGNDISNILSRVTGGNLSNIDGLIRANGSANLFLINPAGIIFGEGASLAIGGSFYGSTADSILFDDGEFSAVNNLDAPILTINAPIGLNFRDNPSDIVTNDNENATDTANFSLLAVAEDQSINLIGGNLDLNNTTLFAPGGNIELGGLQASGTVNINENGSLSFPENIAKGNISLDNSQIFANFSNDGEGGSINLNANNIELLNASFLQTGIDAESGFVGAQSGDINLNATGTIDISGGSSIFNIVNSGATGNAGEITLNVTESFQATEGSFLQSDTFGEGNAGNITINGETASITFEGINPQNKVSSGIFSSVRNFVDPNTGQQSIGSGNSGQITINADSLSLANGAQINNSLNPSVVGEGNNIDLTAQTISLSGASTIISAVSTGAIGNAGNITLNVTESFQANGGSFLQSDTFGEGNAGNITLNGETASITFDGVNPDITVSSGIFSSVRSNENLGVIESRNSGQITINADSLSLANGAQIRNSLDPGVIGEGNNIDLTAKTISLSGASSIISAVDPSAIGNAGDIKVNVQESFQANGGSLLQSNTLGEGDAGNITINGETATILLSEASQILSGVALDAVGSGGNIDITADTLSLSGASAIAADTSGRAGENGSADAGDITLNVTESFQANSGSVLQSDTFGEGDAGNITINGETASITFDGLDPETNTISPTGVTSSVRNFSNPDTGQQSIGSGNSGQITINADSLSLANEAQIINNLDLSVVGEGNNINLTAKTISLSGASSITSTTSGRAGENGGADAGDITLNVTESFQANGGSFLQSDTFGEGNAGNITINGETASITFDGLNPQTSVSSGIFSLVNNFADPNSGQQFIGSRNSGQIKLNANSLSLANGAQINNSLNSSVVGEGNIIDLIAKTISLSGASLITSGVSSDAVGTGGNIGIMADTVSLSGASAITSTTSGKAGEDGSANAGNITLNVTESFQANGGSFLQSDTFGEGNAGNITINGETASITFDGTNPETNVSSGIFSLVNNFVDPNSGQQFIGSRNSGQIKLNANSLSLANGAQINNSLAANTVGEGNNIDLTAKTISLSEASSITSTTSGRAGENGGADAGDITINVTESFQANSGSFLQSDTFGEGDAGDITVKGETATITLDGTNPETNTFSGIFSLTNNFIDDNGQQFIGRGKGGRISISATNLPILNGAAINASTLGEGDAGSVSINVSESITLDGTTSDGEFSSGISSSVEIGAIGNGGSVEITTPNLEISNGAGIFATTVGEGNGGNITLNISDRLTLRENSTISVQASENNTGGDITINAQDGFVVAFPNQNEGNGSDISAFSRGGAGGNITIEAQGVLGIEERDATLGNNTNDIDASGTIEDGSVEITSATTDAIQAVNQLPSIPVEPGETVVQACSSQRGIANSNLVVKGKGGVPNLPDAILSSEIIRINGEAINSQSPNREDIQPISTSKGDIILARGVEITEDGGIILTAYETDHSSRNPQPSVNCN